MPRKRSIGHDDNETGEAIKKSKPLKKGSTAEEKKALASDYEEQLKSKHQDKYTRFQYKLWAEMLVSGVHSSTDDPPAASMFMREAKHPKRNESTVNETVIDGMMSVMNTLTLRKISRETVDTPNKLKDVICDQYGSVVGVDAQQMDVGYFFQAKKLWINNRLDMNDFWDVIEVTN